MNHNMNVLFVTQTNKKRTKTLSLQRVLQKIGQEKDVVGQFVKIVGTIMLIEQRTRMDELLFHPKIVR